MTSALYSRIVNHLKLMLAKIVNTTGVKPPTVSHMKQRGHYLRLSSLKRYVEAFGGKVRLDIELPDGFITNFAWEWLH